MEIDCTVIVGRLTSNSAKSRQRTWVCGVKLYIGNHEMRRRPLADPSHDAAEHHQVGVGGPSASPARTR